MVPSPKSHGPDSNGVCSVCVRKFQKWDGEMETSRKIWEKGLDLLRRDGFRFWGEGARHPCDRLGVAFGFAGHYLAPIDILPDDLDLLWKRSR